MDVGQRDSRTRAADEDPSPRSPDGGDVAISDGRYIDCIRSSILWTTSGTGGMDPASQRLLEAEWPYIRARRSFLSPAVDRQEWTQREQQRAAYRNSSPKDPIVRTGADGSWGLAGIALSGGGIRSATFGLGVLQALAHRDLLRRFDYLSTVSGGGYIGSSLTWLTSWVALEEKRHREGTGSDAAAARPEAVSRPVPPMPAGGFGVGNSAGSAPIFPFGTEDPRLASYPDRTKAEGALLRYLRQHGNYLIPGEGITLTSLVVIVLRGLVLNLLVWLPILVFLMAVLEATGFFRILQYLAGLAGAAIVSLFAAYSLATYLQGKRQKWMGGGRRTYALRRLYEDRMRWLVWFGGVCIVIGSVPIGYEWLLGYITGPAFTLAGLVSGFGAFIATARPTPRRAEADKGWGVPTGLAASVGAALMLYGLLLIAYGIAKWAVGEDGWTFWSWETASLVVALGIGIATGICVDLNLITAHRFYRDRLMEAFLPDIDTALAEQTGPAHQADSTRLSQMCDERWPVGPYHLINTNLVLTQSSQRTYRLRGGDNFILSPRYCGSNATGWELTERFMDGEITLPTAMAVSGAAANPWTGCGGVGVTRNPLVGTLMALLNLRLGFWVRNPCSRERVYEPLRANHFVPGLWEVMGLDLDEGSRVCLLSDGGHFENLGLYELIRRRVRLALVCDGAADPDYEFADLQVALERIWSDFGTRIEFRGEKLTPFMPTVDAGYPMGARISRSAHAVADIIYPDGTRGVLLYLTTALVERLRVELMGYKGSNWDFPDQSTGDQFFDEAQFEAYRELGYVITDGVTETIEKMLEWTETAPAPSEVFEQAAE